jgi:hypothetical protein
MNKQYKATQLLRLSDTSSSIAVDLAVHAIIVVFTDLKPPELIYYEQNE